MLMDLKKQLKAGDTIPITLVVESGGQRETVEVKAAVRPMGGQGAAAAADKGHHGHKH
jgi:copper(I)-binding protein